MVDDHGNITGSEAAFDHYERELARVLSDEDKRLYAALYAMQRRQLDRLEQELNR